MIFNNTATAASVRRHCKCLRSRTHRRRPDNLQRHIERGPRVHINSGAVASHFGGGQTIFNDTSTAANASIENGGSGRISESSMTIFNDTSTAGHATITNDGGLLVEGQTIFEGSATADGAILVGNGMGRYGGGILF